MSDTNPLVNRFPWTGTVKVSGVTGSATGSASITGGGVGGGRGGNGGAGAPGVCIVVEW